MPNELLLQLLPILKTDDAVLDTPATAGAVLAIREKLQVSQKALAIEMGISQGYLCDLEGGHRRWTLKLFNSAKDALGRLT